MPTMHCEPAPRLRRRLPPSPALRRTGRRGRLNAGMIRGIAAALLMASVALAQAPTDPFPAPIPATDGVIRVRFVEFATIPDIQGEAPRMMNLVDEPGTKRMFVNTMRGPLYTVSYDGKTVTQSVDINDPDWGVSVQAEGREGRVRCL